MYTLKELHLETLEKEASTELYEQAEKTATALIDSLRALDPELRNSFWVEITRKIKEIAVMDNERICQTLKEMEEIAQKRNTLVW